MALYSEDELINFLKSVYEIDVTKTELKQCKPEFVQKIYMHILKDFGAAVDMMTQISFDAPENMHKYPEMFREISFLISITKTVKYYLHIISPNEDFTLEDLVNPSWPRTQKIFSILFDFYGHIYESNGCYKEVEAEVATKDMQYKELQNSIHSLNLELRQRQKQNAEDQIVLEKEMRNIEIEKEEIEAAQEMKTRLKGRLEGIKEAVASLTNKKKEVELHLLEQEEYLKTLKSQVIQDGELEEIESKEASLRVKEKKNSDVKENIKELQKDIQNLEKACDKMNCSLEPALQEYESELKKKEDLVSSQREVEKELKLLVERREERQRKLQLMTSSLSMLQEEKATLQNSWEVKKKSVLEDIEQSKLTLEELKAKNYKNEVVEQDLSREEEELRRQIEASKNRVQNTLDRHRETVNELKRIYMEQSRRVNDALKKKNYFDFNKE